MNGKREEKTRKNVRGKKIRDTKCKNGLITKDRSINLKSVALGLQANEALNSPCLLYSPGPKYCHPQKVPKE